MADGDEQFRLGVEHGFNDEPCYAWQDAFHQARYDAGYLCGHSQRVQQLARQWAVDGPQRLPWGEFVRRMAARGLVRDG